MLDGEFDDFLDFHDLLFQSSDHVVGRVGNGFDLHQRDQWIYLGGQYLMEGVGIISKGYPGVGDQIFDIDLGFIQINDVFSFGMDLYEYFVLSHLFYDLSNVRSGLLQVVEFFSEHAHLGIQFVSACLQALQVGDTFLDGFAQFADLGGVVSSHAGVRSRFCCHCRSHYGLYMYRSSTVLEWIELDWFYLFARARLLRNVMYCIV
mmetsp:Transcript_842/g.1941  ORF Transcript_842/g.1941 Transcript_842/m.1941 type:complete len:205 (-) Transcript_842:224-838(-)